MQDHTQLIIHIYSGEDEIYNDLLIYIAPTMMRYYCLRAEMSIDEVNCKDIQNCMFLCYGNVVQTFQLTSKDQNCV